MLSFEAKILDATTAGRTQIQLVWSVRNAVDLWLDRDDGEKPPRLQPEQNTVTITTTRLITRSPIRLTLRADNYDGGKAQKTILVPPSTKPEDSTPADIVSFSAEPSAVEKGKEVALRYAVHSARGLVIRAAGVAQVAELRKAGSPPANVGDSFKVQPAVSTEYELAEEGGATARARVTVTDPPA